LQKATSCLLKKGKQTVIEVNHEQMGQKDKN